MSRITGTIIIDFETGETITESQFNEFESRLKVMVSNWEMMIDDAAEECGFEADDIHPIMLDEIDCFYE